MVAPKDARYHPRAQSVRIAGGVGTGKVRLWAVLRGRWNGEAAAGVYRNPIKRALRRAWPGKRRFTVLEDNDPAGWKSQAGAAAKRAAGIRVFAIPKRSPDLSVMDYAIWKAVSRRLRRQERTFPANKGETQEKFVERLKKTARRLPSALVTKSIADLRRRCQRLHAARGGHFEEGGL